MWKTQNDRRSTKYCFKYSFFNAIKPNYYNNNVIIFTSFICFNVHVFILFVFGAYGFVIGHFFYFTRPLFLPNSKNMPDFFPEWLFSVLFYWSWNAIVILDFIFLHAWNTKFYGYTRITNLKMQMCFSNDSKFIPSILFGMGKISICDQLITEFDLSQFYWQRDSVTKLMFKYPMNSLQLKQLEYVLLWSRVGKYRLNSQTTNLGPKCLT